MANDCIYREEQIWNNVFDETGKYIRVGNDPSDPLNVFIVDANGSTPVLEYSKISSLANGALTNILSYTVPVGKTLILSKAEVSGCSVAQYSVEIDSVEKGVRRTYWGNFNADFQFDKFQVAEGLKVEIKVIHGRPAPGDFNATLVGSLI